MESLLEVVFEDINKSDVIPLLMHMVAASEGILDVECTEDYELMAGDQLNLDALNSLLRFNGEVCAFLTLPNLKTDGITIPLTLLRLVKYGNKYDIDFNFDMKNFPEMDITMIIKKIYSFARDIGNKYTITSFFAGMEPASDKDTRYFTNDKFGPLQ